MDDNWIEISELTERELDVVQVIDTEDLTRFSFEGIKRILKIHPEILSRTLTRLIQDKILKKTNNGYCLTIKGEQLVKKQNQISSETGIPVLQSFLPPDFKKDKMISTLEGKWFGNLRWLGYSKSNQDIELKWITTDGNIIVSVVINEDVFHIYTKSISEIDFSSTLNVAFQLMGYITKSISTYEHN